MVSVLMSVFNESKDNLQLSIESIVNQSYSNFEFIIINDGSNSATTQILKQYKDPRISLHTLPYNQGISKALNIGLKLCRGTYILRQDSDNISSPDRLKLFLNKLQEDDSDLIYSNFSTKYQDKQLTRLEFLPFKMIFFNHIEHNVMYKKQVVEDLGSYPENLSRYQDYLLWLKFIMQNKKISFLEKSLYYYGADKSSVDQPHEVNNDAYNYTCTLLKRIINQNTFFNIRNAIRNKQPMSRVQHLIYKDMITDFSATLPADIQTDFISEYYHENSSCIHS